MPTAGYANANTFAQPNLQVYNSIAVTTHENHTVGVKYWERNSKRR